MCFPSLRSKTEWFTILLGIYHADVFLFYVHIHKPTGKKECAGENIVSFSVDLLSI